MNKKIKKLFRSPSAFMKDSFLYRSIFKRNEQVLLFVGFSTWKQYIRKYFKEDKCLFIKKDLPSNEISKILNQHSTYKIKVLVWGYKIPPLTLQLFLSRNIPISYVEDGFIRSIGLGATKCPPMSLCIDNKAPYFDTTKITDLETILNEYDFSNNPKLIVRAKNIINSILNNKISKYNNAPHKDVHKIYGEKKSKRILVIGQVEDDASIIFGCNKEISNNDVVLLAAEENPSAEIIYKPHPDVINGFREKKSDPNKVSHLCKIIYDEISLPSSLETIDHVYTITSLSGFEALMRGIKVTTLGDAFYSSWGLTDDRQPNPRKKRKLSIEEIFSALYILYPNYYDLNTGNEIEIEDVITNLLNELTALKQQPEKKSIIINKSKEVNLPKLDTIIVTIKAKIEEGNIDQAEALANELWEIKPWDVELGLLISNIYRKKYKFDNAIFMCEALSSRVKNWRVKLELYKCLQERGDKSEKMEAILLEAISLSPKNNPLARLEFIKYLWATKGIGPEVLRECNYLVQKQELFKLNATHNMLIAAIFCEAGRYLLCERQFIIAKNKDPDILYKVQYFNLMDHLRLKGLINEKQSNLIEIISRKLNEGQSYFEELIRENKDSFCIVGNAPTEIGKGKGMSIDANNIVIRFNAYSTSYPEFIDYGLKTNIWVKTGAYLDVPRKNLNAFDLVIISGYNPANRNAMGVDLFIDLIDKKTKVCLIPNFIYEELFILLGATPSAGLAMVYWIYKIIGLIDINNIFGISFGNQEKHASEHYFTNPHKVKYSSHLWDYEAVILKKCITDTSFISH